MNEFAVFILSHGRPDNVITFDTLKKQGYTGKVFIIIDNEDKTSEQYYSRFGKENVIMFDKIEVSKTFDSADNFDDRKCIIYARNACFEIAERLGYEYFLQVDDDYTAFDYRLYIDKAVVKPVINLDSLFNYILKYYKTLDVMSICMAQGGDFIGGLDNGKDLYRFSLRKAMNTFFCSTRRKFNFVGRINEDVNTYTYFQSQGNIFLTIPFCSITQKQTQGTKGGMTETYLSGGTYLKSFYSVLFQPSAVKLKMMNASNKRIHHSINWDNAVPCIIDEKHKKYE
ncbi:MAG TPA: hypothetical protein PLO39_10515 [Saprospiraceae bacterium]|nr:hypothetical protein [Saprospiraceae bacterium]